MEGRNRKTWVLGGQSSLIPCHPALYTASLCIRVHGYALLSIREGGFLLEVTSAARPPNDPALFKDVIAEMRM